MDWYKILKVRLSPIGQSDVFEEHSVTAAVVIPIGFNSETGRTEILLTKRTDLVETHKNQVGFPGGVYSAEDNRSLIGTALRETEEEIGVKRTDLEILGQLTMLPTIFDVKIFPFVAKMDYPYPFQLNPDEVAKLIFLPLDDLLNKGFDSMEVLCENQRVKSIGLLCDNELIWGASAKILNELRTILLA